MHHEKDYFLRDIERMTLFLKILLRRIAGLKDENFEPEYDQIEKDLKSQIDFTLGELCDLNQKDLLQKLKGYHISVIEGFIDVAHEFLKKSPTLSKAERSRLAQNILVMLDFVDENSKTFSIQRQSMRTYLADNFLV